nr:MAG TPA: hypothetical protein [Caudoviricetes sp.]
MQNKSFRIILLFSSLHLYCQSILQSSRITTSLH